MANATWTDPLNLIVPNGVLQNSSEVFYILDPDVGGASTFSIRLSANGIEPVTHWGCRTPLQWPTYDALKNMTTQQFKAYVDSLAATRGRTSPSGVAFKNSLLMNETMNFWDFAAAQGLQPVQSGEEV